LLAENFLLAAAGGRLGLLVSAWSGRLLWAGITSILQGLMRSITFDVDVSLDARVLLFGAFLSALTTLLFGLAPAPASTRVEINAAIKPVRPRLRGLLLGAQVAAVIVLLSAAWGLASGVRKSKMADLGFEAKDVYMAMFIYSPDAVDPKTANRRLRERLASVAGVDSVTIGDAPQGGQQRQSGSRSLPALLALQIARGVVWVAVLFPCLRRIESRGRAMLVLAVGATTLGALAPLAAPNNLIPLKIRLWHMLEMTGSHTAFGVFTAWVFVRPHRFNSTTTAHPAISG
jgi:hypothetical protein